MNFIIRKLCFIFFLFFTSTVNAEKLSKDWTVWKGDAETVLNGKPCGSIITTKYGQSLNLYSTCGRSATNKKTLIEISGGELGETEKKRWEYEWSSMLKGPNSRTKSIVLADIEQNPEQFKEILDAMHSGAVMVVGFENSKGDWWQRSYTLTGFKETYKKP